MKKFFSNFPNKKFLLISLLFSLSLVTAIFFLPTKKPSPRWSPSTTQPRPSLTPLVTTSDPSKVPSTSDSTPQPIIATPTSFPSKYLIKTDFIEQAPEKNWDQPWQDACEEAALLTVDFYYSDKKATTQAVRQAILDMIDYETSKGYQKDVNIDQMATIASDYLGYQTRIITDPTITQIKQFLIRDIPIIIPASGKKLFVENSHFKDGGPYYHNLVILGYDDKKSKFTVHDVGTRHGAYFKYSYQLLMDSIHDFPDSGQKQDISTGAKKILLLVK